MPVSYACSNCRAGEQQREIDLPEGGGNRLDDEMQMPSIVSGLVKRSRRGVFDPSKSRTSRTKTEYLFTISALVG